jgi:ferric-dicitrate binding protein FerR (iron transport regulator)
VKNGTTNKSVSSGVLPSWANPELSFDNTPLDKVVSDLSAFYNVNITLDQTNGLVIMSFYFRLFGQNLSGRCFYHALFDL